MNTLTKTNITNKEIWGIAYPIMFGSLAQTIITFTDTAFLGHIGVVALGASMMAGLYYFVFTTLAMGFAVGIQIIIARRFGEKRFDQIGIVFSDGSVFVLSIGVIMFVILRYLSPELLNWIINSPNIYSSAIEYINIRQFGIIFVCFNYLFRSLYVGISNTKVITYSTVIMAVVNIVLDYCLIFGNYGFPEMGIGGAALASLAAEITATCFFILYTYFTLHCKHFRIFVRPKFERALIKNILTISTPTMIQRLFSFGAWFAFFILIEKMGETAIGISSMVRSAYMVIIIPAFGFGSTANTLTSRMIGEGRTKEVQTMLSKVLLNSTLCCLPLCVLLALIPETILRIYTEDANLISLAVPSIFVVCVATLVQNFGINYFEAISGTGNTIAALLLEFSILVIYVIYIYFMSRHSSIAWVWSAEMIYGSLLGIISMIYLKYANWQKKKI